MGLKRRTSSGRLLLAADGSVKRCSCCGACECAGDPCRRDSDREFHITWTAGVVTTLFDRVSTSCCDTASDIIHRQQRVLKYGSDGNWCSQEWSGSGVAPMTAHVTSILNGAVVRSEDVEIAFVACWVGDDVVGFEECVVPTVPNLSTSYGEWFETARETWGWQAIIGTDGSRSYKSWHNYLEVDPGGAACVSNCGACCLPDGGCSEMGPDDCAALGGDYTAGKRCGDPSLPCGPATTGACCDGTDCTQETREDCEGAGSVFLGEGIPCDIDPCPPEPTGACCFEAAPCADGYTPSACAGAGGTFAGADSTCLEADCDPTLGACCYPNGFCDLETAAACATNGGTWLGASTVCTGKNCPKGACCKTDGTCVETGPTGCGEIGGFYAGNGTHCADENVCVGACCYQSSHGPECIMETMDACALLAGGVWLGPGWTCTPSPCGIITGITKVVNEATIVSGTAEEDL